jgi:hypothetical protein
MYLNKARRAKITNVTINANQESAIEVIFPDDDWRGENIRIDSNTYNITPYTKFNGESFGSWRARFPNFDNNSIFNVIVP